MKVDEPSFVQERLYTLDYAKAGRLKRTNNKRVAHCFLSILVFLPFSSVVFFLEVLYKFKGGAELYSLSLTGKQLMVHCIQMSTAHVQAG